MSNSLERSESAAKADSAGLEQGFLAKIESETKIEPKAVSYTHLTLPTKA